MWIRENKHCILLTCHSVILIQNDSRYFFFPTFYVGNLLNKRKYTLAPRSGAHWCATAICGMETMETTTVSSVFQVLAILTGSSRKRRSGKSITLSRLKAWDQTLSRASKLLRMFAWRDKTPPSSFQQNPMMHIHRQEVEGTFWTDFSTGPVLLPQGNSSACIHRPLSNHCSNWDNSWEKERSFKNQRQHMGFARWKEFRRLGAQRYVYS